MVHMWVLIFIKPGARRLKGRRAPGLLKITSVRMYVCVSAPQAMNNYSRETESE